MIQALIGKKSGEEYLKAVFLLCHIFINDLFLRIKTVQLNMYVDDGQLYSADTDSVSLERRISREVSSANGWYEINGMIANPSKHQGMTRKTRF